MLSKYLAITQDIQNQENTCGKTKSKQATSKLDSIKNWKHNTVMNHFYIFKIINFLQL